MGRDQVFTCPSCGHRNEIDGGLLSGPGGAVVNIKCSKCGHVIKR